MRKPSAIKPRDVDWDQFKHHLISCQYPTLHINSPEDIDNAAESLSANNSGALSQSHKPETMNITNKLSHHIMELIK